MFQRYIAVGGYGVAPHARGFLYDRREVDPALEALTAERDALKAERDDLAEVYAETLGKEQEFHEKANSEAYYRRVAEAERDAAIASMWWAVTTSAFLVFVGCVVAGFLLWRAL